MQSEWIDTYAHFSVIEALANKLPLHSSLLTSVKGLYSSYQAILNQHTHLLNIDPNSPKIKWLSTALLTSNLPFSALQTEEDLLLSMKNNQVLASFVCNQEPYSSHLHYLDVCAKYPDKLYPILNLAKHYASLPESTSNAVARGAIAFAIHPILEKIEAHAPVYFELAAHAEQLDVPLVCRTGVTYYPGNSHSSFGEVQNFKSLVEAFPKVTFVMSHSNLAHFETAIEFAREHENVMLDSVWQNVFSFKAMLRALGPDRLMLGSDWPVLGGQQSVQLRLLESLNLPLKDLEKLTKLTAMRIYKRAKIRAQSSSSLS